ncbi:hypothetical protein [Marinobacter nauticus]
MSTQNSKTKMTAVLGEPMTPEAHLVNTTWFRMAIAGPLTISIITAFIFTIDIDLRWSLSPEGMNSFLNLFKLPLGIASLSLPLTAVVAANHRSMQTAQQIREQNSQNIFANHLQHRNYFFKFVEDFNPFKGIDVSTPRLYESLFPFSVKGKLEPNRLAVNHFIGEIIETAEKINGELSGIYHSNELLISSELIEEAIFDYFYHREIYTGAPYSISDIENNKNLYQLTSTIVKELNIMVEAIISCANFHQNYIDKFEDETLQELEDVIINNLSIIERLQANQFLYSELRSSLDEYVDKNGEFREEIDQAKERFISRLATIPTNLRITKPSKDFRRITFNYFSERERTLIRSNAPSILKESI